MDILKVFSTDDQFQKRQTAIFQTILTSIGEKWRLIYSVRFLKDKQQNTTISGKIHLLPSKETLARKEQTLTETDIFHKIRVIFLNDYYLLPHCHLGCRVSFFLVLAKITFGRSFCILRSLKYQLRTLIRETVSQMATSKNAFDCDDLCVELEFLHDQIDASFKY